MTRVREFAAFLKELADRREPFVLATVVRIHGSTLGKPGFKAVISKEGRIIYGSLGGVCPESAISAIAVESLRTGQARLIKVHLQDAAAAVEGTLTNTNPDEVYVETNCGGMMEIYVDPYQAAERLIMIGQGGKDEIEDWLVKFGRDLGFETVVIDHLPVLTQDPDTLITDIDYDLNKFPFSEWDSVVVLTKGERDVSTLEVLARKKLRFIGMLASRQRARDDMETLRKKGVPQEFIDSVHSPIGIDIGAITPEEIALSIMGDIIGTKRGHHTPHKTVVSDPLARPAP